MQRIINVPTAALAAIVAGLVREGVTFEVSPWGMEDGLWCVTLLGGY